MRCTPLANSLFFLLPGLLLIGQAAPAQDKAPVKPAFLVEPYLQLPTPTSIRILWETNQKLPARVEYGTTPEMGNLFWADRLTELHEVRLDGLQPGTSYYYRAHSGELSSGPHLFRTAPPPGTRRWRMAVYGDSRSNPARHRAVAQQIERMRVNLIVHTGDIVLNGRNHDSWRREFFNPLGPVGRSVPWVSTIGNHERDAHDYFSYMALPGNERYFGFDYANAHIICLDSNGWIERGRDSKQYQWLTEHLRQKRDAEWTFVAFHHPLFSAHATRPINPLRWDWAPIFLDPANRVDGVLTGHDHFFARNWRMGRLRAPGFNPDAHERGVLFLTSAGGGASLYRTKQRDYVARERSVHHFTLFEFDGDRVTLSAVDEKGIIFDRWQLTKEPTPPDEFCACEVEELRHFLRLALSVAPPVRIASDRADTIDTAIRVPTRFQVPVSGELIWQPGPGWRVLQERVPFRLEPKQPLEIRLQARVEAGAYPQTPALQIAFEPGRFRNRTVDVHPFKLAGPARVWAAALVPPTIDGQLSELVWRENPGYFLLGLPPRGGRSDRFQLAADADWLYLAARLHDPEGNVEVSSKNALDRSKIILLREHFRAVVTDGKQTWTFAVSPEQVRYCTVNGKEDETTVWQARAARDGDSWCVEMALPRKVFAPKADLRVNAIRYRREGKELVYYELTPTYKLGDNPDLLPDWRVDERPERFARVQFE